MTDTADCQEKQDSNSPKNTVSSTDGRDCVIDDSSTNSNLLANDDELVSTSEAETQSPSQLPQASTTAKLPPSSNPTTSQSLTSNSNCSININHEQQLLKAQKDLESMVLKYAKSERENLQNKNKVEELDKKLKRSMKDNDQLANRIKLLTNDKTHLTETLNAKVAQLTVLEQKNSVLSIVQGDKLKEQEEKTKRLEKANDDLLKQIESYKSKEGELLDFSERLSMKHMILQSELDEALKKVPNHKEQYEESLQEKESLVKENTRLSNQIESLNKLLKEEQEEKQRLIEENECIQLKCRSSIDELNNEIKVMRKKHHTVLRELVKEVKQLRSQLENQVSDPTEILINKS